MVFLHALATEEPSPRTRERRAAQKRTSRGHRAAAVQPSRTMQGGADLPGEFVALRRRLGPALAADEYWAVGGLDNEELEEARCGRALQVVGVDELAPARGELLRRLGGRGILLKHERRHPSAWASALLTTLASKRQLAPRARRGLCRQLTRCGSRFEHSELRCKTSVLAQQAWSRLQRSSQAAPGGSMERRGNRTEARGSLALQLLRAAAHGRVRSLEHRRREAACSMTTSSGA